MNTDVAHRWVADYGSLAVGIGSALDNTGVPIFLVIGLTLASILDVSREMMFGAAFVGSVVGDLGVYTVGRYVLTKERILNGRLGQGFGPVLVAGEKAMDRFGFWAVVFGRFVPYVGKITPFLAGSYRLRWLSTVVAVCLGSAALVGLFYCLTDSLIEVIAGQASSIKKISAAIGLATVVFLWWLNRTLGQKADMEMDGAITPTAAPKRSRYRSPSE